MTKFIENVDYKKILVPEVQKVRMFKYELLKSAYAWLPKTVYKEIKYKGGQLDKDSFLCLPAGWRWDGATGAIDSPDILRASCFHDWGCDAIDDGVLDKEYRTPFDKMFYNLCIEDGMPLFRAFYTYTVVLKWGKVKHKQDK
jgi:hypothetical protein